MSTPGAQIKAEPKANNCSFAHELSNADQLFKSGKLVAAKRAYLKVLQAAPDQPDLLHLIGLIEFELGNLRSAEVFLSRAIAADSNRPEFYLNLGRFYNAGNKLDEALKLFQKALILKPDCPQTCCLIGEVFKKQGAYKRAVAWYQKAIRLAPKHSSAYNNLGNCYQALMQLDAAVRCYQQALVVNQKDALATHNLGNAYLKMGLLDEAIACYEKALAESPGRAGIYNSLGSAYQKKNRYEDAAAAYQKALAIEPENYLIHYNLAINLKNQGKLSESIEWFSKTLKLNPEYQPAVVQSLLSLPVIYSDQAEIEHYRKRYSKGIDTLIDTWAAEKRVNPQKNLEGVAGWTNFFLPYQGRSDVDLQKKYGRFLSSVVQTNYPAWSSPKSETVLKNSEKLRVGYISAYLLSHTVGKLFIGWVENADPSDFEIYCYHTQTKTDSLTRRFRNASFQFRHMTGDIASIAEQIVFDKIQILVFLDIGMSATTQILAALRLAPVQCVAWGHPLTTGLPTVDYFLSSDLMEPDNGQDHYSETLVRIPNLSIFYSRPELPAAVPKRQEFGFKDDDFIFLSTQSLFKHLPADDFIYAHIATLVPNAKFVFIDHESEKVTAIFKQRLETIFCEHNLDAENFCIFQPRLSHTDFLGLNTVCDVLLDPPAWSGGMTSLEGLSCGIPVVTLAGKFMRSRHTYAMLKMMDLCETIAADKRDYIRIAARLGTDRKFYRHCAESIHNNRERLYEDRTVIEALEAFYKGLVNVG